MDENSPNLLDANWHKLEIMPNATLDLPGLYEWHIEGVGSYIGKFSKRSRPLRQYAQNVRNLLNDRPYRRNNPDGYRTIHRQLAAAVLTHRLITLTILENPSKNDINGRERALIKERGTLNDC